MSLRDAIIKVINESRPIQVIACEVKSVDQTQHTCVVSPADGSPDYYDVRLRSTIDNNVQGFIPIPKVGSWVLVGCISGIDNYRFVMLFDQLDSYTIICDDIRLNGDQHGAMIIIAELVKKINRLEQTLSTHQHIAPSGGGVTSTNNTQQILVQTTVQELANTKVKHG